jgi:hypothetical protein
MGDQDCGHAVLFRFLQGFAQQPVVAFDFFRRRSFPPHLGVGGNDQPSFTFQRVEIISERRR